MNKQIHKELFKKSIANILIAARPIPQPVTASTLNFFKKFSIPKALQELLIENSFDQALAVGRLWYHQTNDLEKENLAAENINCIKEGLLIVGSGLNGDPIVMDLETLTMGFVFHDELWEDSAINARDVHIDTGLSFGQFYWNAATQTDSFPVDAYMAQEAYGKI